MDLDEIKDGLRANAEDIARHLFPQGKRKGKEFTTGDVTGSPGDSFSICIQGIKQGVWKDFGSGETGTMIDLWAMHYGYHGTEGWVVRAGEECAEWLGTQFEKRGANPQPNATRKTQPKKAPTPLTRRIAPPRNHHQEAPPSPPMPSYADKWDECVAAFDAKAADGFAKSRGLSQEGVEWLRSMKLIGLHDTRHGKALAFPVHDEKGIVIAAHVRNRTKSADGKPIEPPPPKWQYRYLNEGDDQAPKPGTRPWIIGDLATATKVWVFESQYDAIAVLDRLGMLRTEAEWPHIAILITRGAGNGGLAGKAAIEGKTLILWPQNDPINERTGKSPAEEWVKAILEIAGGIPVRRVKTPSGFDDPNDWLLKQPEAGPAQIVEAISQAAPARTSKLPPVRDMAFAIKPENRSVKPDEVICGMARRGDKITIGAPSKGRKTWTLTDLAISVATGADFWGLKTVRGRVLYLNFELHSYTFEERVSVIEQAKTCTLGAGMLISMTIRGMTDVIDSIVDELITYILDMEPFTLIVVDPLYKLMTGRDENKAGDMNMTLAQLEKIAVNTGAAIAIATHFSKGNQAGKDHMDRIGGSGVIGRDGDVIMTMTENETPDAMTITSSLRSYAPIEPFVVRWEYPLFFRDNSIDPAALKLPKKAGFAQSDGGGSRGPRMPGARSNSQLAKAVELFPLLYGDIPRVAQWGNMLDKVEAQGVPNGTAKCYLWALRDAGYIKCVSRGRWATDEKGDAYLDGLAAPKPTEPEQTELL